MVPSLLFDIGWREAAIYRPPLQTAACRLIPMRCVDSDALTSGGQLEFRRHLIKERQHQRDATISHKNHIYALDRFLARSPIAPSQAPAFVKNIDRLKLTENVAREALMQYRDRTIEFIAPVALAAMIDEYAIFGPELGDRLPSFPGVSLSEHFVEIAFDEVLYDVRHSSLAYFR
jgi:hypothetical protein